MNVSMEDKQSEEKKMRRNYAAGFLEFLKVVAIAAIIVFPIRYFLFQPFIVKGESMVPNFHPGDYLIVDEISYIIGKPQRGEVVILKYPLDQRKRFVKRIIGLPGETVEIKEGKITIAKNDQSFILGEEYLGSASTEGSLKITLENDQYFVLGDNRNFSYDSRIWGVLPGKNIIGRAILKLFPLSDIDYIAPPNY